MTCIVGLVDNDKVYIGGDSAGVAGYSLTVRADKKVFKNGDFTMGFTSSFRMGQLLNFKFQPPSLFNGNGIKKEIYEYMVTDFVEEVRNCLRDGGYAENKNGAESGGTFLVGYENRLFSIECDYQVGEAANGMMAVGCGDDLALGSLYTTKDLDMKPEERIELALESAEKYSAGVQRPFYIMNTKDDKIIKIE